ncbi:MAG: hypothetical protein IT367_13915 [Candidatus Hydrogenedentes bacterium]|nr:hypothetical protein [Candidatus Hydrogenedentota bacterium]
MQPHNTNAPPSPNPDTRHPVPDSRTKLGTPCSPAWDAPHIALVEAEEMRLGKRICGARTIAGRPCLLDANHENGRCRFHGGFNLTGAQPGNRNAVIHGLYSRAIQTCGEHCPMWKSCPCAGPDVDNIDERDRPRCPYEVATFNAAVTDAETKLAGKAPDAAQTACELAMIKVLLLRTASALATHSPVDTTEITGEKYGVTSKKPGAYLQAFMRVSSEHRRYIHMYRLTEPLLPSDDIVREQARRAARDTSLLPEDIAALDRTISPIDLHASRLLNQAAEHTISGYRSHAEAEFSRAQFLAPHVANATRDKSSPSFIEAFDLFVPRIAPPRSKPINDS